MIELLYVFFTSKIGIISLGSITILSLLFCFKNSILRLILRILRPLTYRLVKEPQRLAASFITNINCISNDGISIYLKIVRKEDGPILFPKIKLEKSIKESVVELSDKNIDPMIGYSLVHKVAFIEYENLGKINNNLSIKANIKCIDDLIDGKVNSPEINLSEVVDTLKYYSFKELISIAEYIKEPSLVNKANFEDFYEEFLNLTSEEKQYEDSNYIFKLLLDFRRIKENYKIKNRR